ncbi:hypothetical protein SD436_05920 [Streptococcus sp. 2A/TPW/M5]
MMIRSITPADQEQLLLLEEELHDNEEKKHKATLEEALGSKEAISLLAEQAGMLWLTCWRQKTSL